MRVPVVPPCRRGGSAVLWHRSGSLHLQQPLGGVHQTHQAGRASPLPPSQCFHFMTPIYCPYWGQLGPQPALAAPAGSTAGQMAQWSACRDLNQGCLRTSLLTPPFSFSWGVPVMTTACGLDGALHDTFLFFFSLIEFQAAYSCVVSESK